MNRRITVKGTSSVSLKPDLIIITMDLVSQEYDYNRTMERAAKSLNTLQEAIDQAGFNKKDLKTTNFDIRTNYKSYRDNKNNYKSIFDGYICEQGLKLEFDFDIEVMSRVLSSIAQASLEPKINIKFSVKNKIAVSEELLVSATKNARQRAEILANASGVTLGELISIDYNFDELCLQSPTKYDLKENYLAMAGASFDIEPDDIKVSDTVSFVWEIK